MLFRNLSDEETLDFKKWARDNYTPFSDIKGFWHPVIQDECVKINREAATGILTHEQIA